MFQGVHTDQHMPLRTHKLEQMRSVKHTHAQKHARTNASTHAGMHAHTHARAHAHAHAHTHTQNRELEILVMLRDLRVHPNVVELRHFYERSSIRCRGPYVEQWRKIY